MLNLAVIQEKKLKKSVFGHFFHKDGISCGYNALKIITVYFDSELYPYIENSIQESVEAALKITPTKLKDKLITLLIKLAESGIIVPNDYDEMRYLRDIQKNVFSGPNVRVMVLQMTDFCNLQCRYCFIEGNIPSGYKRENMTTEVIESAIDKFGRIIEKGKHRKNPSIVFYGGEPLANWDMMLHGLEYLKQQQELGNIQKNIDKIVITNGTLITHEIAKELKRYGVMVSLSIDGPEEIHNANRIYRGGKGCFSDTMKGFEILKEEEIQPTVSCVLSKGSIKHASEIIHWLLDELKIKALGFNHVSIVPNVSVYDPEYEESFGDALLKVQEIIQEEYPNVYERRMNHKINCFIDKQILKADCTGCGEQMSVSPDGKIGICQGYMGNRKTFGGSVFDENYFPSDDPVFIEWSMRSPLNMPKCQSCSALATCGGGCPRNADFINGSIWEVDSAFCHFAKKAQEWMVWKKYQNIQEG